MPTITTPRLILRPFRAEDVEPLTAIYAQPGVMRYLGEGGPPPSLPTVWRAVAAFIGHDALRGYGPLAIEERSTGSFVGRTGPYFPVDWPEIEVGWVIDPHRQGMGYATEAGGAALQWCFENLRVDRVCSLIRPENLPSIRVAEKLGAAHERSIDVLGSVAELWVHRRPASDTGKEGD